MFYATRIKSVGEGIAVDVQGRTLSFIGYLPVEVGDTVYTDGNIIFGHVPPKGGSNMPDESSGIPVLGEEYLGDNNQKEMRGYFNKRGVYKASRIAGDDWIVNDKKKYFHDTKIQNEKIIDAEVSADGEIYLVTDGLYRTCQSVKYNNHLFRWLHSVVEGVDSTYLHAVHANIIPYVGEEVELGVDDDDINKPISIYKRDKITNEFNLISAFNLKALADIVKEKALDARDDIMAQSNQTGGINYWQQPDPPESFIALTYARPLTFRIDKQGDCDAIIIAGAYGYCFPYFLNDGSALEATFDSETPAFDEYLPACIDALERYIFVEGYYPFLNIDRYPAFTGTKKRNEEYTDEYKNYCEDAIKYYIPRVRFKHYEWQPVLFNSSMMFHVHNEEIVSVIKSFTCGGHDVLRTETWNEQYHSYANYHFTTVFEFDSNTCIFPLGNNFFLKIEGNSIDNYIYDNTGKKVVLIPPFELGALYSFSIIGSAADAYYVSDHIDQKAYEIVSSIGRTEEKISLIWHRFIPSIVPKNYMLYWRGSQPISFYSLYYRKFPNEFLKPENLKPYRFVEDIFDTKTLRDDFNETRDGFFRFNPSFVKLSGSKYLFGLNNEELWLYDGSRWKKISDGLKNFRLQELKDIRRAKK